MRIVAVTKGFDASAPRAAYASGLSDIGENYPDELLAKAGEPRPEGTVWHMLGAIQRRRVKSLAPVVGCWQTVSREAEISSISRALSGGVGVHPDRHLRVSGRNGCTPEAAPLIVSMAAEITGSM